MPHPPIEIFISYARSDSSFVDRLEADLRQHGFDTWLDRHSLAGGQNWRRELQAAIDRSQIMLVVLSPEAVASEYVQTEYAYAIDEGKIIIPLYYRPCKVPMDLRGIQSIDFLPGYEQGLTALVRVIHSRSGITRSPASSVDTIAAPPEPLAAPPESARSKPEPELTYPSNDLPTGIVTFLFMDIEGSPTYWEEHPESIRADPVRYAALLRSLINAHDGFVFKMVGDAAYAAFATPSDAVAAAVAIQQAVAAEEWGGSSGLLRANQPGGLMRMALHTGAVQRQDGDYFGPALNRAARLLAAGSGGQILLSAETQELTRDSLPEGVTITDLGEYGLKDLLHAEHVYQLLLPDLPGEFPPLKSLERHTHNLPVQPTPFVGREQEMSSLYELLHRPNVRLVTLTGPGGIGKTRLSLQVAAELTEQFADGVFLVPLASVSDSEQVAAIIIQSLGINDRSAQSPLLLLKSALRDKQMLLLLDNFEQVADAAVVVADLLAVCHELKVLVTSRVVLHLRGEHEFVVPPLRVPDPQRLPDLLSFSQYEAVALFISRARAVKPNFSVTQANAPAVAEICARLDGLPLAIELAAARIKYFPPQTLLTKLERRLAVLTGGARDLPVRQQTLRDTIAWSYNLLESHEQQLFRRLSVFVDGCTLEATEQVCTASGELDGDIFETLTSLVDKSLLQQKESAEGEMRFWMLQTLREFGLEYLATEGEAEETQRAHASYYLALAEEAEPMLRGPQQVIWLERLEQEHDNLRAALQWLLEQAEGARARSDEAEMALRLVGALWPFWLVRGYLNEGRSFLERALAVGPNQFGGLMLLSGEEAWDPSTQVAASVRAKALTGAGSLAESQDDHDQAEILSRESLALYRKLGNKAGMASSLQQLADIAHKRSNYAQARSLLEEALMLFKEGENQEGIASALGDLAYGAADQGEYTRARELAEQALAILRKVGDKRSITYALLRLGRVLFFSQTELDRSRQLAEEALTISKEVGYKWGMASSLGLVGQLALLKGDDATARTLLEEALVIRRELKARWGIAWGLYSLASVHAFQCDYGTARRLYEESLAIVRELGDKEFTASCLEGLGEVLAAQGEAARAARLWGTAETLRQAIGTPMAVVNRASYERALASARHDLGEQTLDTALAEGRSMTLEQVLSS